jgi:hypothetical protein
MTPTLCNFCSYHNTKTTFLGFSTSLDRLSKLRIYPPEFHLEIKYARSKAMGILKVSFWETLTGESIFPQSPGCRFIVRHLDHFKDRNSDVRPSRHLYDQNTGQTASFDSQHGPDCPAQPDLHKCMRKTTSASTEFLEGRKSNQESLKLGL